MNGVKEGKEEKKHHHKYLMDRKSNRKQASKIATLELLILPIWQSPLTLIAP